MARYRHYSIEFKRQVVETYLAGERSMHALAREHDLSRNLIRTWLAKYEAGEFEEGGLRPGDAARYETRIAELERMVGQLTIECELLKKTSRTLRRQNAAECSIVSGPPPCPFDEGAS